MFYQEQEKVRKPLQELIMFTEKTKAETIQVLFLSTGPQVYIVMAKFRTIYTNQSQDIRLDEISKRCIWLKILCTCFYVDMVEKFLKYPNV